MFLKALNFTSIIGTRVTRAASIYQTNLARERTLRYSSSVAVNMSKHQLNNLNSQGFHFR